MSEKVRWYHPIRALKRIIRNQEEILRLMSFDHAVKKFGMHGIGIPMDASAHWHGRCEVCEMRLGDLRCASPTLGAVPFSESYLYRFLKNGDRQAFELFRRDMCIVSGMELEYAGRDREFLEFAARFAREGYDVSKCIVVVRAEDSVVVDGTHRVTVLLSEHGEDFVIKVLKLFGGREDA